MKIRVAVGDGSTGGSHGSRRICPKTTPKNARGTPVERWYEAKRRQTLLRAPGTVGERPRGLLIHRQDPLPPPGVRPAGDEATFRRFANDRQKTEN